MGQVNSRNVLGKCLEPVLMMSSTNLTDYYGRHLML